MDEDFEEFKKRLWRIFKGKGVLGQYYFNVEQLANRFYKLCQEQGIDWRTIDLEALIDPTLTYSENLERLEEFFAQPVDVEAEYERYMLKMEEQELTELAKDWACGLKPAQPQLTLKLAEELDLKPHPACVLSKQYKKHIGKEEAIKECLAEGKIHPSQKAKLFYYFSC